MTLLGKFNPVAKVLNKITRCCARGRNDIPLAGSGMPLSGSRSTVASIEVNLKSREHIFS